MSSWGLGKWSRVMFKPTPTWCNLTFGQHVASIGTEQCLNRFHLDLISLLVNLKWIEINNNKIGPMILSNIWTDSQLYLIALWYAVDNLPGMLIGARRISFTNV